MPILANHNDCTGCMACYNACNHDAIELFKDEEGFLQPTINADICVDCKLCEKSCPVTIPIEKGYGIPSVYAAWHEKDRRVSSSGGAFSAFARKTLEKGGVVYGAAFDEYLHLRHIEINDIEGLNTIRGSKYVQSETGLIYRSVKQRLQEGKEVLFCGTPCQVAGLRGFLRKDFGNLLAVDLACHGVPSDSVFQGYLKKLKKRLGQTKSFTEIDNYEFRRRDGWGFAPSISIANNCQNLYGVDALYMEAFNASALFRKSCYQCPYAAIPRIGDITLGDFWGIGRHNVPFKHDVMKGVSLVLVNTERGQKALEELDDETFLEKRSLEEALVENHNLNHPSVRHPQRECIIADFLDEDISLNDINRKYHLMEKSLKSFFKTWAHKSGMFDATKRIYNFIKSL